jgi:hypothetical protein
MMNSGEEMHKTHAEKDLHHQTDLASHRTLLK